MRYKFSYLTALLKDIDILIVLGMMNVRNDVEPTSYVKEFHTLAQEQKKVGFKPKFVLSLLHSLQYYARRKVTRIFR